MRKKEKRGGRLAAAAAVCLAWMAGAAAPVQAELVPYAPLNPAGGMLFGYPSGGNIMSDMNTGQMNRTHNTNLDLIRKAVDGAAANISSILASEGASATRLGRMFDAGVDDVNNMMKDLLKAEEMIKLERDFDPRSPIDPCISAVEGVHVAGGGKVNRQFRKDVRDGLGRSGTRDVSDWAQAEAQRRKQLQDFMKESADTDFTRAILNYDGIRTDADYKKLAAVLHALTPKTGPGKFKGDGTSAGVAAEAENRASLIYANLVQEPLAYEASLHHANREWGEAVKQLRKVSGIQGSAADQSFMQWAEERGLMMLSPNHLQDIYNAMPGDLQRLAVEALGFGLTYDYALLQTELRGMVLDAARLGLLATAKPAKEAATPR